MKTLSHDKKWKVLIMGAAGRDFHNFNVLYRNNPNIEVVAFTATQIPGISGRRYPESLSGQLYPNGIPIEDEKDIEELIHKCKIDECVLSYSDLSYETVMHLGSRVMASGAKFSMFGASQTMLKSTKPVIAIVAVRTGSGKSQTTRRVAEIIYESGKKVVVVRHPMPYGNLAEQKVQRYENLDDLKKYQCTIEEMEEYEPHLAMGNIIYAGVDYEDILRKAEQEADIILWDGGNNDTAFYQSDLTITVTDPLRPGHEIKYYPGEVNFRLADIIIINKVNTADLHNVESIVANAKEYNPTAQIIKAESVFHVNDGERIRGKKVLVIEDGPTLTHGGMKTGAGTEAAKFYGASEFIDPRPYAIGSIKDVFSQYPETGKLLPAMGYSESQIQDLQATINNTDCDLVVIGTPINLTRFVKVDKPTIRVTYELSNTAKESLREIIYHKFNI